MSTEKKNSLLSRRRFLVSAGVSGVMLAVAGCGGGGGGDRSTGDRYNGTYRYREPGSNGQIAASVTVDKDAYVTFWTLLADEDNPFSDFGQVRMDSNGYFSLNSGTVTTFGQVRNDIIYGRTQVNDDPSQGYDFQAGRIGSPSQSEPGDDYRGTFSGRAFVENDVDFSAILGVSPDGNATFLSAIIPPRSSEVDFYALESLAFNRNGDGYDYYFDFYGDRLFLDPLSGSALRLTYDFAGDGGDAYGTDTLTLTLDRTTPGRLVTPQIQRNPKGLRRAIEAFHKNAV